MTGISKITENTSKSLTPLKAIRQHCLSCNITAHEVKLCPCTDCPLFTYRFGKNPARKGIGGNKNIANLKKTTQVDQK